MSLQSGKLQCYNVSILFCVNDFQMNWHKVDGLLRFLLVMQAHLQCDQIKIAKCL